MFTKKNFIHPYFGMSFKHHYCLTATHLVAQVWIIASPTRNLRVAITRKGASWIVVHFCKWLLARRQHSDCLARLLLPLEIPKTMPIQCAKSYLIQKPLA